MHSVAIKYVLNCLCMSNYPPDKYSIPPAGSCQAQDYGLKILARIIARRHLRLNSFKPGQCEDEGNENGNESKDLPNA